MFQVRPKYLFTFLTQCYYLHTLRVLVSTVGRIFVEGNTEEIYKVGNIAKQEMKGENKEEAKRL